MSKEDHFTGFPSQLDTSTTDRLIKPDLNSAVALQRELYLLSAITEDQGLIIRFPEDGEVLPGAVKQGAQIDEIRKRELVKIAQDGNARYLEIKNAGASPSESDLHKIEHGRLAVARILLADMRVISKTVRRYAASGIPIQDLLQVGFQSYQENIYRFDMARDVTLLTYCLGLVERDVQRFVQGYGGMIRLPRHVHTDLHSIQKARQELQLNGNIDPTLVEIAEASGLSIKKVMRRLNLPRITSLEMTGSRSGDVLERHIRDISQEADVEGLVLEEMDHETMSDLVSSLLNVVTPRELEIIRLLYGLTEDGVELSQAEIARKLGVARNAIHQSKERAFARIKREMQRRGLSS